MILQLRGSDWLRHRNCKVKFSAFLQRPLGDFECPSSRVQLGKMKSSFETSFCPFSLHCEWQFDKGMARTVLYQRGFRGHTANTNRPQRRKMAPLPLTHTGSLLMPGSRDGPGLGINTTGLTTAGQLLGGCR